MAEILHPDWITVRNDGKNVIGYDQEWYPEKGRNWQAAVLPPAP